MINWLSRGSCTSITIEVRTFELSMKGHGMDWTTCALDREEDRDTAVASKLKLASAFMRALLVRRIPTDFRQYSVCQAWVRRDIVFGTRTPVRCVK
jgi:hypothetical protein